MATALLKTKQFDHELSATTHQHGKGEAGRHHAGSHPVRGRNKTGEAQFFARYLKKRAGAPGKNTASDARRRAMQFFCTRQLPLPAEACAQKRMRCDSV